MAETKYARIESLSPNGELASDTSLYQYSVRYKPILKSSWLQVCVDFLVGILTASIVWIVARNTLRSDLEFLGKLRQAPRENQGTECESDTAGNIVKPIEYNETYPGPPTLESEMEWLSLLPSAL